VIKQPLISEDILYEHKHVKNANMHWHRNVSVSVYSRIKCIRVASLLGCIQTAHLRKMSTPHVAVLRTQVLNGSISSL
jgi:hypothetical protein